MPEKKKKKGTKKKIKTPRGQEKVTKKIKKTKSEYESEIEELNRKLAATITNVGPIEEELILWEDKYEERERDLNEVAEYLKAESENQEKEIESYEKKIEVLDKAVNEQRCHYEAIIADIQTKAEKLFKDLDDQIYNTNVTLTILSSHKDQMLNFQREEQELAKEEEEQERKMKETMYKIEKEHIRELDTERKNFERIMEEIATAIENEIERNFQLQKANFSKNDLVCKISALGKKYEQALQKLDSVKKEELEARLSFEIVEEQIRMKEKRRRFEMSILECEVDSSEESERSTEELMYIDQEQQTDVVPEENKEEGFNVYETMETIKELVRKALDTDHIVDEESTIVYEDSSISEDENDPLDEQYENRQAIIKHISKFIDEKIEAIFGKESDYKKLNKFVASRGYKKGKERIEKKELPRHDLWRNWRLPSFLQSRKMKKELSMPLSEFTKTFAE